MPPKRNQYSKKCKCGQIFHSAKRFGSHYSQCRQVKRAIQSQELHYGEKLRHSDAATTTSGVSSMPSTNSTTITSKQLRRSIEDGERNSKRTRSRLQQFADDHEQTYLRYITSMKTNGDGGGDEQLRDVADSSTPPNSSAENDNDDIVQDDYDTTMFAETFNDEEDDEYTNNDACNNVNRTFPRRTESEPSIKFNTQMSPTVSAGVRLMHILQKHTNDSKLYDDVVELINHLGQSKHDFSVPLPPRKKLTTMLEKVFQYSQMKPKLVKVPVASMSRPEITVPVFDAQAVISKMLHNPNLMRPENIASNYDIFSGGTLSNQDDEKYYDEIHTGTRWSQACSHYCGNDENAFPCGLVVFYDKSHKDRHGALCVSPIIFTLTMFNKAARSNVKFWDVLAYVPNLDHGTTKTSDPTISRTITSVAKCQDEHNCLHAALKQLKEVNDSGGIPVRLNGRNVFAKVWIHYIIGDISGNNVLLGSYNNANANNPYRDCSCKLESFLDPNVVCTLRTRQAIDALKANNDTNALKEASKHNIINAFDTIPMGDPINTIYHSTPPETLHAISSGIVPRMITSIGDGLKSKGTSQMLHELHILLCRELAASSEKDFPRPQTRNHILETTKSQASENVGNLYMLLCALHTQTGIDACNIAGISTTVWKGKINTMKKVLSLAKLLNRRNAKRNIPKISHFIRHSIIPDLDRYFPRTEGNGWLFPKVHSLTKFPTFIEMFGAGINFFGGHGESHLKLFMKHYASQTQQRPSNFSEQLAMQHYNQSLFKHALNALSSQLHHDHIIYTQEGRTTTNIGQGHHIITIALDSNSRSNTVKFTTNVSWKAQGYNEKHIDKILQYVLGNYCARKNKGRRMQIESYTSMRLRNAKETLDSYSTCETHTTYRVDGSKGRNDWCMVLTYEYEMDNHVGDFDLFEYCCPARIHGFIRFVTPGTYTPLLRHRHDDKEDLIPNNAVDDTLYVVVHTNKVEVSWQKIEKEFICPLELGDMDRTTFIFPVSRIVNPLFAFPNLGSPESDKGKSFFVSLPARYWPFYIDHIIDGDNCPGLGGFSQKEVAPLVGEATCH